jgi:hypothetical protein
MKKTNKKLQLRVQTFEKKLQLQQIKEEQFNTMYEKTNEDFEQTKVERDTYLSLVINIFYQEKKIILLSISSRLKLKKKNYIKHKHN